MSDVDEEDPLSYRAVIVWVDSDDVLQRRVTGSYTELSRAQNMVRMMNRTLDWLSPTAWVEVGTMTWKPL